MFIVMGEVDRKNRQLSSTSLSPVAGKKQASFPTSEEKKLETAVLQYQNQKLVQKLEFQKNEMSALENKVSQLLEKQKPYDTTLKVVQRSWEELVRDLESSFMQMCNSMISGGHGTSISRLEGHVPALADDVFLSRIIEVGTAERSFTDSSIDRLDDEKMWAGSRTMLYGLATAVKELSSFECKLRSSIHEALPEDSCMRESSRKLEVEVKHLQKELSDLHLKHTELVLELQRHSDVDTKNKADLKRLRGEVVIVGTELDTSSYELAILKAETDEKRGALFPVLSVGNKHITGVNKKMDKQEHLQNMESTLSELVDQAAYRLREIKLAHDEKMTLIIHLANLQNKLKNMKSIWASSAYQLIKGQVAKTKAELEQYLVLFEKLQVEKDILQWSERDVNIKAELLDVFLRYSTLANSRLVDLEAELQNQIDERDTVASKLEKLTVGHGRKEIIANFKALISSFPTEMRSMQVQVSKYKESARDIHILRADVQSLTEMINRMEKEFEVLTARSVSQSDEIQKLQEVVEDLHQHEAELMLILEMLRRESFESRYIVEAKDSEYKAWAVVQSLASSLAEHNLESRVKTAIEAEAAAQQKLASAEAEIAELRQKLDVFRRDMLGLPNTLKSKDEEIEAYLSEIESIGQAYDDMQNQNQHLLQQIIERDDYNIKLYMESVRGRQLEESICLEKLFMENRIQEAETCLKFFQIKATKIDDQLQTCADHIQKLVAERLQCSANLEGIEKKLGDIQKSSEKTKEALEDFQVKFDENRLSYAELRIELEKERFDKKRIGEDLEIAKGRAARMKAQIDGSSILQKLRTELSEYREILKCTICLDKPKEVVITKCFHLFCKECVQKIVETRRRKCPTCSASFGPNDVKLIYI